MFTEKHTEQSFRLFQQLPAGAPFTHLRKLATGDIALDTANEENDTLNIGAYAIQWTTEQVPTIAGPRTEPLFLVYETVVSPGTYWEPEDADLSEFTQTRTFDDALREIILRELFHHIGNIQESDGLTAACSEGV